MQRSDTILAFRAALDQERCAGRRVGLVLTMGALHDGHRSLIERAARECDVAAVTVFVNPLQFEAPADLAGYPADLPADAATAAAAGASHLFAPAPEEMDATGMVTRVSVTGPVTEGLEGAARPGHLDGVATIVTKLLAVAGACRAYFGEKDHQQLQMVRRLVADLALPVEVVACPTVRAPDGLALSSRNARLTPAERAAAPVLYRALRAGAAALEPHGRGGAEAAEAAEATIAAVVGQEPRVELDYAAARPEGDGWRLHVAARVGVTRLVDNLGVPG